MTDDPNATRVSGSDYEELPEPDFDEGGGDNRNRNIIIGVAAFVLLCCCCSTIASFWSLYNSGFFYEFF